MSRARHHHRLRLHLPVSGKFFLIPRFPLHYNSFVPRTRLLLGRLTAWASDQAGPAGSSSGHTGLVRPSLTQKKNRNNYDQAMPICFGPRKYLTKYTFMPIPFILFPFVLISGQASSSFVISENCLKNSRTFLNLFASTSYFFFFLDISLYNWSVNFYCEIQISVWYFFKKYECIDLKIILMVYLLTPELGIPYVFFSYVIFTNVSVESMRCWIYTNVKVRNITSKPS